MSDDREASYSEEALEGNVIGNGREQIVLLGNLVRLKNKRISELEAAYDKCKADSDAVATRCSELEAAMRKITEHQLGGGIHALVSVRKIAEAALLQKGGGR